MEVTTDKRKALSPKHGAFRTKVSWPCMSHDSCQPAWDIRHHRLQHPKNLHISHDGSDTPGHSQDDGDVDDHDDDPDDDDDDIVVYCLQLFPSRMRYAGYVSAQTRQ